MTMQQLLQSLTQPPTQTLRTLQPTPSTVSYTVSTRPVPQTLPGLLKFYVTVFVRLVIGSFALATLLLKWTISQDKGVGEIIGAAGEALAVDLLEDVQWRYLAPGVSAIMWLVLRRGYTEESLLVLQGLGLQTSTSSATYLRTAAMRFIPTTSIQDIFIHEAFKGFEVRFYLSIVMKGEEDVVVVFPTLLPRREILEEVWRGARACLYERRREADGKEKGKGDI